MRIAKAILVLVLLCLLCSVGYGQSVQYLGKPNNTVKVQGLIVDSTDRQLVDSVSVSNDSLIYYFGNGSRYAGNVGSGGGGLLPISPKYAYMWSAGPTDILIDYDSMSAYSNGVTSFINSTFDRANATLLNSTSQPHVNISEVSGHYYTWHYSTNQGARQYDTLVSEGWTAIDPDTMAGQEVIWDVTNSSSVTVVSNELAALTDLSGSGNDMTIPSFRPAYFASGGANNQAYVQVALNETFGINPVAIDSTPKTFYIVCALPTLVNNQYLFRYDGINGTNGLQLLSGAAARPSIRIYTGFSPFFSPGSPSQPYTDRWMLVKVTMRNASVMWVQINDDPNPEITTTGGGANVGYPFLLFDQYPGIKISEVRVFNKVLSNEDDNRLRHTLMAKYRLKYSEINFYGNGNSHLAGVMSGTNQVGGPYQLRLWNNAGVRLVNSAVSGSAVYSNPPNNLVVIYDSIAKPKYNNFWWHIEYGTNDAAVGLLTTNPQNFEDTLVYVIRKGIEMGIRRERIFLSTPPYSTGAYVNATPGGLDTLRKRIYNVASRTGVTLVDFYAAVEAAGLNIATVAGGDGIHGDSAIHQVMYLTFKHKLDSILNSYNYFEGYPGPYYTNYSGDSAHYDGNVNIVGNTTSSGSLTMTSTAGYILPPRLTTTQRNALPGSNGMVIFNTTTNQIETYNANALMTISGGLGTPTAAWIGANESPTVLTGDATLDLTYSAQYVLTGTATTLTLPPVSGTTGRRYWIKNRGSLATTVNTTASANEIYSTTATNTLVVAAGASIVLVSDGTFFNLE